MTLSAREIQEHLLDLGYIDRGNSPTLPFRIYEWCREHRVSAMQLDSALGWKQGTTTLWVIAKGLPHLTGEDPGAAPPPAIDGVQYGSGIKGTQAAPIGDPGLHAPGEPDANPPPDPRADFLDWIGRTRFGLPGDEPVMFYEARRRGITHAQIEEWLDAVPGSIDAECRARGMM